MSFQLNCYSNVNSSKFDSEPSWSLISIYFPFIFVYYYYYFESDLFFLVFIYVLALDMVRDLTINTENTDQEVDCPLTSENGLKSWHNNANFRQKLHSKMHKKSTKTETDQRYLHSYSPFSLQLCDNNLIWIEEEEKKNSSPFTLH